MSRYVLVLLLISSLLFTSCATKKVWSPVSYKEVLGSPLITEDGKKLVLVGKKYHYIFDLDSELKDILLSKRNERLTTYFDTFKVDENNKVVGGYALYYPINQPQMDQDINWLKQMGFTWSGVGSPLEEKKEYCKDFKLVGMRYLLKDPKTVGTPSNTKYCLMVEEPDYQFSTSERLFMTPVSVAADGVLILGGTALFLLSQGHMHPFTFGQDKYKEIDCTENDSR